MWSLTWSQIRNADDLSSKFRGREKKFEFVKVSVSEKLTDDGVAKTIHKSVVFAGPTIYAK